MRETIHSRIATIKSSASRVHIVAMNWTVISQRFRDRERGDPCLERMVGSGEYARALPVELPGGGSGH